MFFCIESTVSAPANQRRAMNYARYLVGNSLVDTSKIAESSASVRHIEQANDALNSHEFCHSCFETVGCCCSGQGRWRPCPSRFRQSQANAARGTRAKAWEGTSDASEGGCFGKIEGCNRYQSCPGIYAAMAIVNFDMSMSARQGFCFVGPFNIVFIFTRADDDSRTSRGVTRQCDSIDLDSYED